MMTISFTINWDYRCPFARNANEHVITALRSGEPLDVRFTAFSQSQTAVEEGGTAVWDDPDKRNELIAVAAGIVVRDRFPDKFHDAHLSLFAMRHDDGEDIRDEAIVRRALERAGVDADAVMKELEEGWPFEVFRSEHESSVANQQVFGVPTFIAGEAVVFVRLMTRPEGDAELAKATVEQVLNLASFTTRRSTSTSTPPSRSELRRRSVRARPRPRTASEAASSSPGSRVEGPPRTPGRAEPVGRRGRIGAHLRTMVSSRGG